MTRCARCGRPDSGRKLYPPLEWVEYLRTERGLPEPEGVLAVSLCADCHAHLAPLRDAFRRFERIDADARGRTRDRIETALDDETGPDPGDVRSVL